jgi:hypothetical protein
MFQRIVVCAALLITLAAADSVLAQCGQAGGGRGAGGFQGGGGGGFQMGQPIFAQQNPMIAQMAMQQSVEMQRLWLQQKYVEAVIQTQEKQRKLAIRSQRAAKNREETGKLREQNRAKIAAATGGTVKNPSLASSR